MCWCRPEVRALYCWRPECGPQQDRTIEKPPIGLMPRKVWLEQRMNEIGEAVQRYEDANKDAPQEWIREWNLIRRELPTIKQQG